MRQKLKYAILILFFGFFLCAFCAIGIYRFNIGQVFYYDFGIFAHIIWQLSRFQVPVIDHLVLGKIIFLGDHFNPGLALFAPLFWITSDLRILLIEQAVAITCSGVVIYLIARKIGLRFFTALAVTTAYLLFAGTENPLVTDWHPESTSAMFLLLFFYLYYFTNKKKSALITLALFLSLKESNAVSGAMLLIPIAITLKEKRNQTILLIIAVTAYFFLATKWIIPHFAHQAYIYSPNMPLSPVKIAQNFVNKPEKIQLLQQSFFSFGYLPALSLLWLIPVLAELAQRLAPYTTIFNNLTLGQHYNVLLGVFLALSTIWTIKYFKKLTRENPFAEHAMALYVVLVAIYVARKITGSPVNLAINATFWHQLQPRPTLFRALEKVPKKGSVMGQNSLLPYLVNRTDAVYLTTVNYKYRAPSAIIIDLTSDQNMNNFYGSDLKNIQDTKIKLESDTSYRPIETGSKDIFLYVKK